MSLLVINNNIIDLIFWGFDMNSHFTYIVLTIDLLLTDSIFF